jgi:hypothetical protein
VFVAADNVESIQKLKNYFGSAIKCNADFHRLENENHIGLGWEYDVYFKKYYWTEAVIDAMMLAKSKKLICRTSNFSNAAILFGNYEEIERF